MSKFISEWKSVSDNTLMIASAIGNEILRQSKSVTVKISPVGNFPYKEGQFRYNTGGLLGKINDLTVRYTIYYCRDERDYEYLYNDGNRLKCEADYDEEFIDIVTAYIGNNLQEDFLSDISHEINHLLQYSKGFNKSGRTENRYNTAIGIAQNNSYSFCYRVPSFILYYTFRHEVDSFAVQFYSFLKRKIKSHRELSSKENSLINILDEFQPYINLTKSIELYNDNINSDEISNGIKALNMNQKTFEFRTDKGVRRFMRKMNHVYDRLCNELNRSATAETVMRRAFMLHERFGDTPVCYEHIYAI